MNVFKRLSTLALATLAVFATVAMSGCDQILNQTTVSEAEDAIAKSRTSDLSSPTIAEDGYLTVGLLSGETTPLLAKDGTSVSGLDVDVASILADELGLKVRFVSLSSVDDAADMGCDVVMGAQAGDSEDYTVVGSYAERAIAVLYKGNETVLSASDFSDKVFGLQAGSASQRALEETNLQPTEKAFSNLNEAMEALDEGSVDYVVCDAYAGAYLATTCNGVSIGGTLDEPAVIGVAVAATNSELTNAVSNAMDALASNGLIDLVRVRWVGDMTSLTADSQITGLEAASNSDSETSTDQQSTDTDESSDTDSTDSATA